MHQGQKQAHKRLGVALAVAAAVANMAVPAGIAVAATTPAATTPLATTPAATARAPPAASPSPAPQATRSQAPLSPPAQRWWSDITALASDSNEGRLTGSKGYLRAANYVISRFKAEGLKPAGVEGFLQPVKFEQQTIDQAGSHAELVAAGSQAVALRVGEDILIAAGGAARPARVEAPLVFIGYGLHLPVQGYDDLAGVSVKGKVVVMLSGGPSNISGAIKSNARFLRAKLFGQLGAVGMITLTTPKQIE